MQKESSQALLLVLMIVVIFTSMVVIIAASTVRDIEFREVGEAALKADCASISGYERAQIYLKSLTIPLDKQVTIEKLCPSSLPPGKTCLDYCPDSTKCNTANCNCDKDPLLNQYAYSATITLYGKNREDGNDCACPNTNKICCCESYCIDTNAMRSE